MNQPDGSAEPSFRYAVILARPEGASVERLSAILAAHRGIPLPDAARQARRAWGFVGEGLGPDDAHALAGRLKAEGIEAIALPDNLIEELPEPGLLARGSFEPAAFVVAARSGEPERLAWHRIALIAAAGSREPPPAPRAHAQPALAQSLEMLGLWPGPHGSAPGPAGRRTPTQPATELKLRLEIFLRKPLRCFRLDAEAFDYSCLKGQMAYNVLANFRTLACELARRAGSAMKTRGVGILMAGEPITAMGYESLDELDRESRWLLTLALLKDP